MTPLRESVLAKLKTARSALDDLFRQDDAESSAIEWQKGYAKALEEVLDLEGLSLRRSPRRATALRATVVRADKEHLGERGEGTILDLSEGGCRLATAIEPGAGEVLELTFRLSAADPPMKLQGWVRRVQPADGELRVGVEFKDVAEDAALSLRDFCARPDD